MTDFITGIWNIIRDVAGFFKFIVFIDQWEQAVITQAGKFRRVVGPGWRLIAPFTVDEVYTMNVMPTAMELEEQSLTTRDGRKIVCRGVLMWSVTDIRKCIVDVEDAEDTLGDIAVGVIQEMVEEQDWDYIRSSAFRKDVRRAIQKQASVWGIKVSTVKFQDLVEARTYRLFGSH